MEKELTNIFESLSAIKNYRTVKADKQVLEGISFRYKTVQFHLVDDTFEEIEKASEALGNCKIYSERFSLPGYGVTVHDDETDSDALTGDEFQFEIIVGIEQKSNLDLYYEEIHKVFSKMEEKHDIDIYLEPYKDIYDTDFVVHRVIFYTNEEGIFPKE